MSVPLIEAKNRILAMLSRCGVCNTYQAATVYEHRADPVKRVRPLLSELTKGGYLESRPLEPEYDAVYRLSKQLRHAAGGIKATRWDGLLTHKFAVTDLYLELGSPSSFKREPRLPYRAAKGITKLSPDAFALVEGVPYFFEVQRTPIETVKWALKRRGYEGYFASGAWMDSFDVRPVVVIWQAENQQKSTIGTPIGFRMEVVTKGEGICGIGEYIRSLSGERGRPSYDEGLWQPSFAGQ